MTLTLSALGILVVEEEKNGGGEKFRKKHTSEIMVTGSRLFPFFHFSSPALICLAANQCDFLY